MSMTRAIVHLLLAAMLETLAGITPAKAQGLEPGRRWALVATGESDGARNDDANAIASALRSGYGYSAESIQVVPGVTRAALYAALHALRSRVGRSDSLLVYIAARTASLRSKSTVDQLLLVDSDEKEPWTALDVAEVLDRIGYARAGATLLMLDSCAQLSGTYGSGRTGASGAQQRTSPLFIGAPIQVVVGCPPDSFGKAFAEVLSSLEAQKEQRRVTPRDLAMRMMDLRRELRVVATGEGPFVFERVEVGTSWSRLDPSNDPADRQRAINDIVGATLSVGTEAQRAHAAFIKIALDRKDTSAVRTAAVRAIGMIDTPSRERDLARVIRDEAEIGVVRAGISTLERLGSPAAVIELEQLIDAPEIVARAAAIRALGRLESRRSLPHILKRVAAEQGADALLAALEVLPVLSTAQNPRAVSTVLDLLRRGNLPMHVEIAAIGVIGLQRTSRAEQVLIARLTSGRPEPVRAAAAVALSNLDVTQGQKREDVLINASNDASSIVRESAVFALGRLKSSKAVPALAAMLGSEKVETSIRAAAATAIGEIGARDANDLLVESLEDDSPHVRGAAATALGKVGDRDAVRRLRDLQDDKDGYVRMAADVAIRRLGSTSDPAEDLTASDPGVRRDAISRLAASTRTDAGAMIVKQLADPNPDVVATAITELSRMKGTDPTPALLEELQRQDYSPQGSARRRGATLALGARAPQAALDSLLAAARDRDLNVRNAALAALANYDDPRVMDALLEAETDPSGALLHAAADALTAYGNTLYARERLVPATRALESALRRHERLFGSNDLQVAVDLNNLGVVLLKLGRLAEAEATLTRALLIREQLLGPSDPETATTLINLGLLYANQKDFARAEPLYLRALGIRESAFGPNDSTVGPLLDQLATMYKAMGRAAQAEAFNERASRMRDLSVRKKF